MRPPSSTVCVPLLLLWGSLLAGCTGEREYPHRPITLTCPWAAGGGTDRVSRQIAAHLEQDLGVPVSVVNATGGKGVTGHSRGLTARPDGYTLAMITLELNMMHWSGLTELTHRDCIPLMSVNEDYAALFVRKDSPWQSLADLEAAIRAEPKTLKASGTASGGAWHLAVAGWLLAADMPVEDVVWISSTGANPSLQELISGGVHMVCCSLPEAAALSGEIRALGVMAPKRALGYEDVPTFAEQGRDWSLGGWRALAFPLGTPPEVVDRMVASLERVVTGQTKIVSRTSDGAADTTQTFPQFMEAAGFDHTYRASDELREFLDETDEKFGELLTSEAMRSVNQDRYHPLAFPGALAGLLALAGVALAIQTVRTRTLPTPETSPPMDHQTPRTGNVTAFLMMVSATIVYCLAVQTVGFLLLAGAILLALLVLSGNRIWVSVALTVLLVPSVYQLFSGLLRVPLPQGWWGW